MSGRVLNFFEFSDKYSTGNSDPLNMDDISGAASNFEEGFDDSTYDQPNLGPQRPISGDYEATPAPPTGFSSGAKSGMDVPEEIEDVEEEEKEEEEDDDDDSGNPESGNPESDETDEVSERHIPRVKGFARFILESDWSEEGYGDEDFPEDEIWGEGDQETGYYGTYPEDGDVEAGYYGMYPGDDVDAGMYPGDDVDAGMYPGDDADAGMYPEDGDVEAGYYGMYPGDDADAGMYPEDGDVEAGYYGTYPEDGDVEAGYYGMYPEDDSMYPEDDIPEGDPFPYGENVCPDCGDEYMEDEYGMSCGCNM